jgi:hypothetical protein
VTNVGEARAWKQQLASVGFVAILLGALDPMEGSLIILPGSALVALGFLLTKAERRVIVFRLWMLSLIALGVGALWGFSAIGGIGGETGLSMWWGLLILPYVFGLSASLWGLGSPRWVLALGLPLALFYLSIPLLMLSAKEHIRPNAEVGPMIMIGAVGLVTFVACALRLVRRLPDASRSQDRRT